MVVVGDDVTVVVVVSDVVWLVVGVVIVQPSNPPRMKASVIKFNVSAMSAQVSSDATIPAPTHLITASSPAGPRYSSTAAAIAVADAPHESPSCSSSFVLTRTFSKAKALAHDMVPPILDGQLSKTCISMFACDVHALCVSLLAVRKPMPPDTLHSK